MKLEPVPATLGTIGPPHELKDAVELMQDMPEIVRNALAAIEMPGNLIEIDPAAIELRKQARIAKMRAWRQLLPHEPLPREVRQAEPGRARQFGVRQPNRGKMGVTLFMRDTDGGGTGGGGNDGTGTGG